MDSLPSRSFSEARKTVNVPNKIQIMLTKKSKKKTKKLEFKESDIHGEQLFWDDTIWQTVDEKWLQNHPAIK